jgi:hypothetical protein
VNIKNQSFRHSFTEVSTMVMDCALDGCENQFEVKIYPRQYIYPKYCPEHRNEYKRIRHLQLIGREDLIEQMKLDGENIEIEHGAAEEETESTDTDTVEGVA